MSTKYSQCNSLWHVNCGSTKECTHKDKNEEENVSWKHHSDRWVIPYSIVSNPPIHGRLLRGCFGDFRCCAFNQRKCSGFEISKWYDFRWCHSWVFEETQSSQSSNGCHVEKFLEFFITVFLIFQKPGIKRQSFVTSFFGLSPPTNMATIVLTLTKFGAFSYFRVQIAILFQKKPSFAKYVAFFISIILLAGAILQNTASKYW